MKTLEQLMRYDYVDHYVQLKLDPVANLPGLDSIPDLLINAGLAAEAQEAIYVVAIDPDNVRSVARVAVGEYHSVIVPIPAVLAIPLLAGAERFVIAHNHPSGRLVPSSHDYAMIETIVEAANVAGLIVHDNLIMNHRGQYVSFKDSHVLKSPKPRKLEVRA